MKAPYSTKFYDDAAGGSLSSARAILSVLWKHYQPSSVLDVGCGNGCWLSAAGELGAAELTGIEGEWMKPEKLMNANIKLVNRNLETPGEPPGHFDLAMSVEVAEHVQASVAPSFVRLLCQASDVVLFGAAIPHQGGTSHVNEQPQSYWVSLFAREGFQPLDLFRPAVWNNERVDYWYRQNTFLFVKEGSGLPLESLAGCTPVLLDVVHPSLLGFYAKVVNEVQVNPSFGTALRALAKALLRLLGARK
jgi:SAM-dependent methyltransferase